MPIYAYRCSACGHAQDVLQKLSDPVLTVCPACGAECFAKQVTAAGFQLKGSGWYVTDFRGNGAPKDKKPDEPALAAGAAAATPAKDGAAPEPKPGAAATTAGASSGSKPSESAPAPAPAAPSPPPATGS